MNVKRVLLLFILIFCIVIGCVLAIRHYNLMPKIKAEIETISDKISNHPKYFPIILSENEKELIITNMKSSKNYLEFGSGGSTFLALLYSNADIVSVENDKEWIKYLKTWRLIRKNNKRLQFYYVDTGKTGDYGWPVNPDIDKYLFPYYSAGVFKSIDKKYDLVFVDGRSRVACTLQTILNTDDDVRILIHDFTNRPQYHELLKFLKVEKTADTMVLLKKKKNINRDKVLEMYEKYKCDCN